MPIAPEPAILFVCLGNICRSPLAEAALRAAAEEAGESFTIDSAGTGNWHVGDAPDLRAQATARRHGLDISGYRARQVSADDFYQFTHIYALDADNLRDLGRIAPADGTAHLGLLMDMVAGREGTSVIDPYHGDVDGFETTWQDVTGAAKGIMARLLERA